MKMRTLLWRTVGGGALLGAALVGPNLARGADHTDSPAATAEPSADIADLYAWMSADAQDLNLVLTVNPFAGPTTRFSDATQYVMHVASRADFGATTSDDTSIVCQFYTADELECWVLGDDGSVVDYVEGDPSNTAGLVSASGDLRVFAGPRNDPFFFNLDGFRRTVDTVRGAAGGLSFDAGNCPAVNLETSNALVAQLTTDADDSVATDDFDGANILALVIQVDKGLVTTGGPILAAWAGTHIAE